MAGSRFRRAATRPRPRASLLAVLLAGWTLGAAAAPELPDCSRPLTLAYHDHGLLYSRASDRGIDKDVAMEMLRRSGCRFEISVMPRARIWMQIESGQLDFSMSGISNEAREKFAGFAWYLYNKYYLIVRKEAGAGSLADFEANPRLKLGAIRSFRYSPRLNQLVDRLAPQQRITEVADHEQLLSMMKLDRIQGMIIEPFNYTQVDRRSLAELTQILEVGDPPVLHGLIMSKRSLSEAEQAKWRALIEGMRRDGTLLKILSKYFEPEQARSMVNF